MDGWIDGWMDGLMSYTDVEQMNEVTLFKCMDRLLIYLSVYLSIYLPVFLSISLSSLYVTIQQPMATSSSGTWTLVPRYLLSKADETSVGVDSALMRSLRTTQLDLSTSPAQPTQLMAAVCLLVGVASTHASMLLRPECSSRSSNYRTTGIQMEMVVLQRQMVLVLVVWIILIVVIGMGVVVAHPPNFIIFLSIYLSIYLL